VRLKIDPAAISHVLKRLNEQNIAVRNASRTPGSDEFELTFIGEPDGEQIKEIVRQAIIDHRLKQVEEYDPFNLRKLTKEQIENYIDTNVTDLATAKQFLKKHAALTLYLYRRIIGAE